MPPTAPSPRKSTRELAKIPALRDLQYAQPLDYPTLNVTVDRDRAGQFGVTMADVARSLVAATSSSRFIDPNYWRDPRSGNAFQIQVRDSAATEWPRAKTSANLPVMNHDGAARESRPLVDDVATVDYGTTLGEVDRYNMQRVVRLTANMHGAAAGDGGGRGAARPSRAPASRRVACTSSCAGRCRRSKRRSADCAPACCLSVAVIFLLLAANFQSFRLALAVVSAVPAVICGVLLMLLDHRHHAERAVVHGRDHGDWDFGGQRDSAGDVRGGGAARRRDRHSKRQWRAGAAVCARF